MNKKCPICRSKVTGRSDKRFCCIACKNNYYIRLKKNTTSATEPIDKILHRNRSILLETMGRSKTNKKISRLLLDNKKFNFDYVTGFHINTRNKTIHHVYDFSWAIFSDQEVLIICND